MTNKPILCVDFDGVIHSYTSGWKGANVVTDPPTPGAIAWLAKAIEHFDVHIYSSRSNQEGGIAAMREWLHYHIAEHYNCIMGGDPKDYEKSDTLRNAIDFCAEKPPAFLTIDDRALTFMGTWHDLDPYHLTFFKPWNKRS